MVPAMKKVKIEDGVSFNKWLNDILEHPIRNVVLQIKNLLTKKNDNITELKIENATFRTKIVNSDFENKELRQKIRKITQKYEVSRKLLKRERTQNSFLVKKIESLEENYMDKRIVEEIEEELSAESSERYEKNEYEKKEMKKAEVVDIDGALLETEEQIEVIQLTEEDNSDEDRMDLLQSNSKNDKHEKKDLEHYHTVIGMEDIERDHLIQELLEDSEEEDSNDADRDTTDEVLEDFGREDKMPEKYFDEFNQIDSNQDNSNTSDVEFSLPISTEELIKDQMEAAPLPLEELLSDETSSDLMTVKETVTDNTPHTVEGANVKDELKVKADAPQSNLPLRLEGRNILRTGKRRKTACQQCSSCLREDCGDCSYCRDKPKFGGPNTKRKKCILKKCQNIPS